MEDKIRTLGDLLKPIDEPEITEKAFIKRWNHFDLKPGNVIDIDWTFQKAYRANKFKYAG